jgi:DNA mismatch endonuclease (patch repair protein)
MSDTVSPDKRSWIMSRVPSQDTKTEIKVRSLLHKLGYRFRLHDKKLPGHPDIALKKYRTAIFVHGCFWHQHPGCKKSKAPLSNVDFWLSKFERNVRRDKKNIDELSGIGWKAIIVWECELKDVVKLSKRLSKEIGRKQ